ncbi:class I SAM-dependent methyltransferase [Siminovitchia sediminis]|uniref:Class I SAM-dependent methyltransferase n=1 Tax=Siminovitchia sediminis TaxID=1274353 RepID=A0ABW4KHX8_9BACI
MNIEGVLSHARSLMQRVVRPGGNAIDGTVGNGNDTLFLAKLVGKNGRVFGFDIQQQAIQNTTSLLEENGVADRVTLFQRGHETLTESLPQETHGKISGAMFNLGYLPGGDKTVVTQPETTIAAITQLLSVLEKGGVLCLVIYPGHEEGALERDHVLAFAKDLDQSKVHVLQYGFINQKNNPPFLLAFEKK